MANINFVKKLATSAFLFSSLTSVQGVANNCDVYSDPPPSEDPSDGGYYDPPQGESGQQQSGFIYPTNISASPSVSTNGNFTITWDLVTPIIDHGSYIEECQYIWLEIYKDGDESRIFDTKFTNDCTATSYQFTDYPVGSYSIGLGAEIIGTDTTEGYEANYGEWDYDNNTVNVNVYFGRKVVYIHTDMLGSPIAESH
ncbi:hypothetical protein C2869_06830 [Saccharobesus litoralis]|uniref:Uncharacterized protein n=1 Tax=Saccharobesus litoralis TaxID=2172099 RepID=A0A2S0VPL3_9ALTE|nr:hypothetical protein [Saccharobesus litoralis]AWB66167.1 hypothetical protein C2869_06830 [Saccharobesus litoralis]